LFLSIEDDAVGNIFLAISFQIIQAIMQAIDGIKSGPYILLVLLVLLAFSSKGKIGEINPNPIRRNDVI
jgi:ABC-type tungstate transport system substrate-binding protein